MRRIPVALQLYSVREDVARDFTAAVSEVARIGYAGVELAGYGNLDVRGAQRALADAGLAAAGMHVARDSLRGDLERVADEALLLNCPHVICSWLPPEEYSSAGAVVQIGREFDEIGERLRSRGLTFSFHNHAEEFRLLEGRPIMSWILDAAAPRHLKAELDVYWAHAAGYAPERYLYQQGERVRLLHLKDEKAIGGGPVDFGSIFTAVDRVGSVEWLVVEQEKFEEPPLQAVRRSFEQLQRWGRA